ncbi:MAG: NUDIX domain-containing protein [Patescibacteria group bacterium]
MENKELHRISITGIVYRKRKDGSLEYLITRRALSKKAFPGRFTVPGGGLETDDYVGTPANTEGQWYRAAETALKREIREEVNLMVDNVEYLLDIAHILPDGIPSLILSFYCRYVSGEVKLDADSIDYKWVTLAEAKNFDLIEGIYGELELVDKKLLTKN